MAELVPFIQLGFAAVMAVTLLFIVRGYMEGLMAQNRELITSGTKSNEKIADTLATHLSQQLQQYSAVAQSQTLVAERLRALDAIPQIQSDIRMIQQTMARSTIVSPDTEATIKPVKTNGGS